MVASHPDSKQIFARLSSIQDSWDDRTRRRRQESGRRRRQALFQIFDDLLESDDKPGKSLDGDHR